MWWCDFEFGGIKSEVPCRTIVLILHFTSLTFIMICNLVFFCLKSFSYESKVFIFNGLSCPLEALPSFLLLSIMFSHWRNFYVSCKWNWSLKLQKLKLLSLAHCLVGSTIYMEHGFEKLKTNLILQFQSTK